MPHRRCGLAILLIAGSATADPPPQNLAPNSQWEIASGLNYGGRINVEGTGSMASIDASGYTVGSSVATFATGATGELKVGDLVTVSGPGVDKALLLAPMRVIALASDRSVSVRLPLGHVPATSAPVVLTPVNIGGDFGSTRTGDAFDGWKKTPSLPVWREDNSVNLSSGAYYAMGTKLDSGHEEVIFMQPDDYVRFVGRTVSFGADVFQKVRTGAGTWRAFIQAQPADDQGNVAGCPAPSLGGSSFAQSADAPATPGYHWLEVSLAVPRTARQFCAGLIFKGAPRDTYYIKNPVLTYGATIGENNYVKPQEYFIPIVHVSPIAWVNANVIFPTIKDGQGFYDDVFDLYAETGGKVAPTVRYAQGSLEGINANPVVVGETGSRVIAWRDRQTDPVLLGPIMGQFVSGVKSFAPAIIPLDGNGLARYFSGVPGDSWFNVSMDLDLFILSPSTGH